MRKDVAPLYHGRRTFLGKEDLVVSFFTEKCQYKCSFCDLGSKSSQAPVTESNLVKQIHWLFDQYQDYCTSIQQLSIGNEGSILDQNRFYGAAMDYLIERSREISSLEWVSFESRPEYIKDKYLQKLKRLLYPANIDVTVGFETQEETIRNGILNKRISRKQLEKKIALLGSMDIRLTSYVMLKPSPFMSEEEGILEAKRTIEYLHEACTKSSTSLVVYLNPTYIANNSPLAALMNRMGYKPPKIQSVVSTIRAANSLGIPIYTGLWSEKLADENGDYRSHDDYDKELRRLIKQFNATQNFDLLSNLQSIQKNC
jgi:archaeosine synthase beta-subunit